MDDRICGTCRHFEWSTQAGRGWCRNPRLFTASQSQPVSEFELSCASRQGDYWEASDELLASQNTRAAEPEQPVNRSTEYDEHDALPGGGQVRGSSADQPGSSDNSMYNQPSDVPPPRSRGASGSERVPPPPPSATSGSGGGGDRPPAYQSEERYWTDYLRIALPIAGLLLLLSVFWYWASSFIGGDDNPTQTPIVAVNVTPQNAPTLTPTLADAIQLTPQLPTATTAAVQPTQPVEQPTEAAAQPTQAAIEPTQAASTGKFAEGDLVIVNDNDVNMRSQPSTTGEIVDTLTQGTELRVLSGTPTEAEGYVWWNVSDDALGVSGWIAGDFIEK